MCNNFEFHMKGFVFCKVSLYFVILLLKININRIEFKIANANVT